MLGNQYFMARNYTSAQEELQKAFLKNPSDQIKKKLIVCYTQTGNLDLAVNTFTELLTKDIKLFLDTDPIKDDCPCTEIINQIENSGKYNIMSKEYLILLGIIWMYCETNNSLNYFRQALELDRSDERVKHIIELIKGYNHSYNYKLHHKKELL